MKTVGQILREAREAKGLSIAQAAEGTRSKSQTITALEADDFSRFPAPIYTRGFIKLYAEFLGLNAPELISLYQARHAEADKLHRPASVLKPSGSHTPPPPPSLAPELDLPPPAPVAEPPAPAAVEPPAPPTPPAAAPSDRELELPFDRPAPPAARPPAPPPPPPPPPPPVAAPAPVPAPAERPEPPPPPKVEPPPEEPPKSAAPPPPPPVVEPPKVAPVLPEAPRQPVEPAVPHKKVTVARPAPAEFDLAVREAGTGSARNRRAASLLAQAQASAGRLPWRRILVQGGIIVGILLLAGLLLTIVRGCAARRGVVPKTDTTAPAFHAVPEPPPMYFPDSTPGR